MIDYRISAARFLSTAVIGVCFFLAWIGINMQRAGRPRTFGLLGVMMLLASTVLQAINGSLAGVYGRNTVLYGVGFIMVAVLSAVGLVLLALAVVWARRTRRLPGDH
jgi:drug/metabolite transporter (DMT)-like permease